MEIERFKKRRKDTGYNFIYFFLYSCDWMNLVDFNDTAACLEIKYK